MSALSAECQRLAAQIQMTPTRVMGGEFTPLEAARDIVLAIARATLERQRVAKRQQRETASDAVRAQLTQEIGQLTLDLKNLQQGWGKAELILASFVG